MSRAHSSLPLKSNALSMPVPVMTQTVRAVGDRRRRRHVLLAHLLLPPPSGRFQRMSPLARSTAHSSSVPAAVSVRDVQEDVSFQMIGVAPLRLGIGQLPRDVFAPADHFTRQSLLAADAVQAAGRATAASSRQPGSARRRR